MISIINTEHAPQESIVSSFQLNNRTLGFHQQTQKLEPLVQHNKQHPATGNY